MEEEDNIRETARKFWKETYRELEIYRIVVKYRKPLYWLAAAAFIMGIPSAFDVEFSDLGKIVFTGLWGFLIAIAFIAGANHIYIATRIGRILRKLSYHGIFITKKELLDYCRDLIEKRNG